MNDPRVLPARRKPPREAPARSESEALMRAALAVSRAAGSDPFAELTEAMCDILGCDAGFIAVFTDEDPGVMRTLACTLDGRLLASFDYPLVGTPCEDVTGRDFKCVPTGIRSQFPPGTLFAEKGMDGYAGFPLTGSAGQPLGLIVAMCRRPLSNAPLIESILKIFAARVAAEVERRRAEAALLDSEASYRAIFEASEDCIFVHDWDSGRILDVSPAAERLYGYAPAEMRDLSVGVVSENVPPYTECEALALIQEAKSSASPLRFEWHARHKDGHLLWNDVTLKRATIAGKPRVLAFVRDVTDRKAAEEGLRASEARYRLLFETESDALLLVDVASLRLVDANPAAEDLWGYDRAELLSLTVANLSAEPDSTLDSIRTPTGRVHIPLRWHRRRDGTVFPVEITANRLLLDGRLTVVAAVRDITARRQAEEALRASEEQYRAIFNASADALVLRDAQFRIVDVNATYEAMSGYSRAEVIGVDQVLANPPQTHGTLRELHDRALAGEPMVIETQLVRRDGLGREVELRAVPVRHRGEPHVLWMGRDITERKRTEEALRGSEEQYRAMFNASADALMLWNSRLQRVDVNAAHEKIFGFAREDVVGRGFEGLPYPDDMVRPRIEMVRRALGGEACRAELEALRKDGRRIMTELRTIPFQHRGEPHVLQIARDITDRKRAEEERVRLEAQLRQAQKMEAIGQLTGGIAHDFNNILTSVVGYVVLASERDAAAADPRLLHYLEQAEQSCRRARDLIQQMLTFSRGQRGERRGVALAALVREGAQLVRPMLPASLELQIDAEADAVVRADPVQLEQVLLNLCINARDATNGSGVIRVAVRERERCECICASCRERVSGRYVELSVADDGPGIAPELLERIFEPFFSTKDVGKGTGMGLSVVHGIVHEHEGHVCVDAPRGGGTVFRVLLPVADAAADDAGGASRPAVATRRPRLSGRVLLVDDEHAVLAFMRELLESWGLTVTACGSAADALEALDACDFSLVITDQTMPRMTGLQFAAMLRERRPRLPVVLYTGYAEGLPEGGIEQAGIRALVRKPIEPAELRRAITPLLPPR
jgi:PAS domain S-box-containing protein